MEESISKNEKIREKFELLSVDCPMELVAQWAAKEQASERDYEKVASLLDGIKMLRDRNNCKMLRNMSGLPKVSRQFRCLEIVFGEQGYVRTSQEPVLPGYRLQRSNNWRSRHRKDAHRTGHRKPMLRQAVFDQVLQDGGTRKEA